MKTSAVNLNLFLTWIFTFLLTFVLASLLEVSETFADQSELLWACMPQQLLMGQWAIHIETNTSGLGAETLFKPEIRPEAVALDNKIQIVEKDAADGSMEFIGRDFDFVIYPGRKPKHNPFYNDNTAVAAEVRFVKFSDHAALSERPFACRNHDDLDVESVGGF